MATLTETPWLKVDTSKSYPYPPVHCKWPKALDGVTLGFNYANAASEGDREVSSFNSQVINFKPAEITLEEPPEDEIVQQKDASTVERTTTCYLKPLATLDISHGTVLVALQAGVAVSENKTKWNTKTSTVELDLSGWAGAVVHSILPTTWSTAGSSGGVNRLGFVASWLVSYISSTYYQPVLKFRIVYRYNPDDWVLYQYKLSSVVNLHLVDAYTIIGVEIKYQPPSLTADDDDILSIFRLFWERQREEVSGVANQATHGDWEIIPLTPAQPFEFNSI